MAPFHAVVLGIIQGLTEFVPVSSSGHLVLAPALLGWSDNSLAFDTALHLGTLLAVFVYFREDWVCVLRAWIGSIARRSLESPNERRAWFILLGCAPAGAAGLLFEDWFRAMFDRPVTVSYFLLVTAGLLTVAEILSRQERGIAELRLPDVLVVGLAQALAILPGISRSGVTIAGGLLVGLTRTAAARFSFLLAAPIILGAGASQLPDILRPQSADPDLLAPALGFVAAAVTGYLCIDLLLRYLQQRSLYPFAAYCAALGLVVAFVLGGFPT